MKNPKRTIAVLSVITVALSMTVLFLILSPLFSETESQLSRRADDNCFAMGFYPLNSSETEAFELQKGDVIDVSLVVMKGSLDIVIGQDGKEPIYEGNRVELDSFQVTVPEDGTYFITVFGQKAEGSISFQIHSQSTGSAGSLTDSTPAVAETSTVEEAYAVVIGVYYTAIEQQWDSAALMENDLNYMIAGCYGEKSLENIGYAIADLDSDGTPELLIGALAGEDFYGGMIFALYALDHNGIHQLVFDSGERNRYYYAGENCFANVGAGAFDESFETTLKFEDGELIDMTYTTAPEDYVQMELTPFLEWIK